MKQLIIPIAIGLLAGLGGGTGFSYMRTSAKYTADSTQMADSLKAHPPAHTATADSTPADATAHDSASTDSTAHAMDAPGAHEPAASMTPADSIRALDALRRDPKSVAATSVAEKPALGQAVETHVAPSLKSQTQSATDAKSSANAAANVVRDARDAAMQTALPEQRLAKIFSAMAAKDAAKVLDQMTDGDVRMILSMMGDRQAAAILTSFPAARAAAITKGAGKAPGGSL